MRLHERTRRDVGGALWRGAHAVVTERCRLERHAIAGNDILVRERRAQVDGRAVLVARVRAAQRLPILDLYRLALSTLGDRDDPDLDELRDDAAARRIRVSERPTRAVLRDEIVAVFVFETDLSTHRRKLRRTLGRRLFGEADVGWGLTRRIFGHLLVFLRELVDAFRRGGGRRFALRLRGGWRVVRARDDHRGHEQDRQDLQLAGLASYRIARLASPCSAQDRSAGGRTRNHSSSELRPAGVVDTRKHGYFFSVDSGTRSSRPGSALSHIAAS